MFFLLSFSNGVLLVLYIFPKGNENFFFHNFFFVSLNVETICK